MGAIETRDLERESLYVFGEMTIDGTEAPSRIKVRNLSARGMMAVGEAPVLQDQQTVVALPGAGRVHGRIIWVQGHRFGIAFAQDVDPRLARQQVFFPDREAPRFARAAIFPKPHGTRSGGTLPV